MQYLPENIQAVIYDIDGTLIDSLSIWADADREFLHRRGIEYDPKISLNLKSLHFVSASQYLIDYYHLNENINDVCDEITEIVKHRYFNEMPLKDGVIEFAKACYSKGVKQCSATSNSRELAKGTLKASGIFDMLEFLIVSDDMGNDKTSPDIFMECARKLGVDIENIAVFEDSPHAAKTAKETGFFTVGIYNGHDSDFTKIKEYTDIQVYSWRDIMV